MSRNLSLALGRVPTIGSDRTTLSIYRPNVTLKSVVAGIVETMALIAAAGRVGAAVEAGQKPRAQDLKTAGLEEAEVFKGPYRI